jgi:CRISPR system Cascade subunit CasB
MNGSEQKSKIQDFISRLEKLDPGSRAILKRSAGRTLSESNRGALPLFYRLLPPGVGEYQQEIYFMVSTLYPLADAGGHGDLGEALRKAREARPSNSKGVDRRIQILLDSDEGQLAFRLRQTINYLKSCGVRVDWTLLLEDLLFWSYPERRVQRRWAQSYYKISFESE